MDESDWFDYSMDHAMFCLVKYGSLANSGTRQACTMIRDERDVAKEGAGSEVPLDLTFWMVLLISTIPCAPEFPFNPKPISTKLLSSLQQMDCAKVCVGAHTFSQNTYPMMTAFTRMIRPMKESKKEEEMNWCMVCRCLSSLSNMVQYTLTRSNYIDH